VTSSRLALAAALALMLAVAGVAAPARAAAYDELGTLERQAVDKALADRSLQIDSKPAGKRVRVVHVVNHEVFSERDSYLQLLNVFHRTTREWVIRREVLLRPGDLYDEALVQETTRNLRDADFSSLVVILPVTTGVPGQVDLVVVTRDVWSLRLNTDFEYQERTLIYFTASLSENNVLGWRKKAAVVYELTQGNWTLGPTYSDPNVAGTRINLAASYKAYFGRDSNEKEGDSVGLTLNYPLFSLASRWGAGVSAWYIDKIFRFYDRYGLSPVYLTRPVTVKVEGPDGQQTTVVGENFTALPYIYRDRRKGFEPSVVRSFGKRVIQRVSAGYSLSYTRPDFAPEFPVVEPRIAQLFAQQVFPPNERISAVFASWSLFTPRYKVYRDYGTYDLREDFQLGPNAYATVAQSATALGSDYNYTRVGGNFGWNFDLGGGFQRFSTGWYGRFLRGDFVDETRSAGVHLATPMIRKAVRLLGEADVSALFNSTRRSAFFTAGGESGLRGYGLNEFRGQARFMGHLEARSRPLALGALRFGGLAFYDVGHAAASISALSPHQDVGVGLRLLIPQLNFYVLRVDWAFPLQAGETTSPGWPGRVSAGFRQVF
jgi:hypothetical protein